MRIKAAAIAAGVMVASTLVAAPADARIVRVSYLPPKYQTYDICVDFKPTIRSDDAYVLSTDVHATKGFGVPDFFCPRGAVLRAMQRPSGLKFKVRFVVYDSREDRRLPGHYTTRVRLLR